MKTDPNCIFCKIISGELPSFKIYEDEKYLAFLDISQFTEGHTVVVPKEHHEFIFNVPEFGEYMEVAKKVADHYYSLGYKYVDTMSWGRMINHAHFHLLPHNGEEGDWRNSLKEIGAMQQDKTRRPNKEKGEEIVKKFRLPM